MLLAVQSDLDAAQARLSDLQPRVTALEAELAAVAGGGRSNPSSHPNPGALSPRKTAASEEAEVASFQAVLGLGTSAGAGLRQGGAAEAVGGVRGSVSGRGEALGDQGAAGAGPRSSVSGAGLVRSSSSGVGGGGQGPAGMQQQQQRQQAGGARGRGGGGGGGGGEAAGTGRSPEAYKAARQLQSQVASVR